VPMSKCQAIYSLRVSILDNHVILAGKINLRDEHIHGPNELVMLEYIFTN